MRCAGRGNHVSRGKGEERVGERHNRPRAWGGWWAWSALELGWAGQVGAFAVGWQWPQRLGVGVWRWRGKRQGLQGNAGRLHN